MGVNSRVHSGFENSRKQAFETLKASPVNFEGRNSLVESEVTSRRLGKMAGKGSIGAQGWLFPEVEAPETEAECPNRGYVRPIKAQWG